MVVVAVDLVLAKKAHRRCLCSMAAERVFCGIVMTRPMLLCTALKCSL
jgi:hypothetical protein